MKKRMEKQMEMEMEMEGSSCTCNWRHVGRWTPCSVFPSAPPGCGQLPLLFTVEYGLQT